MKTKQADARDARKHVREYLYRLRTHKKPMISQLLPALCIAVAFQWLYNYQYWLDRKKNKVLSSFLCQQQRSGFFITLQWTCCIKEHFHKTISVRSFSCVLLFLFVPFLTTFSPLPSHIRPRVSSVCAKAP